MHVCVKIEKEPYPCFPQVWLGCQGCRPSQEHIVTWMTHTGAAGLALQCDAGGFALGSSPELWLEDPLSCLGGSTAPALLHCPACSSRGGQVHTEWGRGGGGVGLPVQTLSTACLLPSARGWNTPCTTPTGTGVASSCPVWLLSFSHFNA